MTFQAMIWTDDLDGEPITIAVREGAALDVAAYAAPGYLDDFAEAIAAGTKLAEQRARAYGAGWPARLHYRR